MQVFLLHHVHELPDGQEDVKLIGVYSSEEAADAAKQRAVRLPGFRDFPEGFHIGPCTVDKDHWPEGYTTFREADGSSGGDLPAWFCRDEPSPP